MKLSIRKYDIIHFTAGVLAGILNKLNPLISLQFILLFITYQLLEQMRIHDKGYRDIAVFTVGWLAGVTPLLIL